MKCTLPTILKNKIVEKAKSLYREAKQGICISIKWKYFFKKTPSCNTEFIYLYSEKVSAFPSRPRPYIQKFWRGWMAYKKMVKQERITIRTTSILLKWSLHRQTLIKVQEWKLVKIAIHKFYSMSKTKLKFSKTNF